MPTQIFRCRWAPHRCGAPGAVPGHWTDVCGFVKPSNSYDIWKVRLHGALTFPHETLGLRPRDQSCHHEVWLHLDLVSNRYGHESRGNREQRVLLKERSCPFPHNKKRGRYDDGSDHSLFSPVICSRAHASISNGTTRQEHQIVNR